MSSLNIRVTGLRKSYVQGPSTIPVLVNANAYFKQGETYTITGSSGSGKSTFLHNIAGLEPYERGSVSIGNKEIHALSNTDLMNLHREIFGIIFQQPYLMNELSVVENIMLKGLVSGLSYHECYEKALSLLAEINLLEKAHLSASSLSGGQQQRISILRALFNKPAFLLADEPTGNLDTKTGAEVVDFLLHCQHSWNMGLIICSHDKYVIQKMQHLLTIENGAIQQL